MKVSVSIIIFMLALVFNQTRALLILFLVCIFDFSTVTAVDYNDNKLYTSSVVLDENGREVVLPSDREANVEVTGKADKPEGR